jgi:hypothetical protein
MDYRPGSSLDSSGHYPDNGGPIQDFTPKQRASITPTNDKTSPNPPKDAVGCAGDVGAIFVAAGREQLPFFEWNETEERSRYH